MTRRLARLAILAAIGAVISLATAWGGVFWRVFVSKGIFGAGEPFAETAGPWPVPVPEGWPAECSRAVTRDLGYERIIATAYRELFRDGGDPDAPWQEWGQQGLSDGRRLAFAEAVAGRQTRLLRRSESFYVFRRRSGFPLRCFQSSWAEFTATQSGPAVRTQAIGPAPADSYGEGWTAAMYYRRGLPWPEDVRLSMGGVSHFTLPLCPRWPILGANAAFWGAAVWGLGALRRRRRRLRRLGRGQCPTCRYPIGVSPVCTECGGMLPIRRNGAGDDTAWASDAC